MMTAVLKTPVGLDVERVRADFPILSSRVHGKPLVYLDNGATTQKPRAVIDAIVKYYETQNANIHRAVHHLSQTATQEYETARHKVQKFINAPESAEVIFTRGTTEGINLVAATWGRANLSAGDVVLVSEMEHHSNIVPWQIVAEARGAKVMAIPINDDGELLLDELATLFKNNRVKMLAVTQLSNSLGTIHDVKALAQLAHSHGAKILVDGAQWVAHARTDVRDYDCDFYVFSGHKLFGPTGIGVLWGKRELLDAMPPYQGGGDMIESVTFAKTTYAPLPNKFEAGTPDIAGVIALGAAIDYVESIGFDAIESYERDLFAYADRALRTVPGLRLIGNTKKRASVLSFVIENPPVASLEIGMKLDAEGIAVRTGHHCCQPVMDRMHVPSTTRISLAMYNTKAEVDFAVEALRRVVASASDAAKGVKSKMVPAVVGVIENAPTHAASAKTQSPRDVALPANVAHSGATGSPAATSGSSAGDIAFAPRTAPSPQAAADELAETFELFGDASEKNEYVLDLGKQLPDNFATLKQISTRVPGCMSEVYLVARRSPDDAKTMQIVADSDAAIVRGLIAVLQKLYSGQPIEQILAFDIDGFFRRVGLDQFVTFQRRNGLAGMVGRIREIAGRLK